MDEAVRAAMARWPNVPECYDWLALDGRGQWRVRGETIVHRGMREFLARNYLADEHGAWYVQNGPQRVYVHLARAPWVLQALPDPREAAMASGTAARKRARIRWLAWPAAHEVQGWQRVIFSEAGYFLLMTERGAAAVDDRDSERLVETLCTARGEPVSDANLTEWLGGGGGSLCWSGDQGLSPVERLPDEAVASALGFVRVPRAGNPGAVQR